MSPMHVTLKAGVTSSVLTRKYGSLVSHILLTVQNAHYSSTTDNLLGFSQTKLSSICRRQHIGSSNLELAIFLLIFGRVGHLAKSRH